jgi:uncharacterized membrane protein
MTPYPRRVRETLLVAHIVVAVSLLGDSTGFLAIAIRASRLDDPVRINELIRVLDMLSIVFGIPLSFASIVTGVALGLGTKWGVFRYPWVIAKLVLIVSVMAVGGLVINPAQTRMLSGTGEGIRQLIAAGAYDVTALTIAVALSVFKPGRQLRRSVSWA